MAKPVMRHYAGEQDYRKLQDFLREVLVANGLREISWHPGRLDYYRWHGIPNCGNPGLENIRLWEEGGKIVAFLTLEDRINVFPNIRPEYMDTELYGEMLAVAETDLSGKGSDGRKKLYVWASDQDKAAHRFLVERGYQKFDMPEVPCRQGRQDLNRDIPEVPVAEGYEIRNQNSLEDIPSRSWCSWKAFHADEPDEKYDGWLWYGNVEAAPLYRMDLDIVAISPDKEIASFCTVWFEPETSTAYFEPVGTHPDHQRKGLSLACINEGLRRVKALGCKRAFLGGHSEAAMALYKKAGFHDSDMYEAWVKFLD